jgi:hypothetical protein
MYTSKYRESRVNPITWSQDNVVPHEISYNFRVSYTFPLNYTGRLICKEMLYVSDQRLESHYKKLHPNNSSKHAPPSVSRHTNLNRATGAEVEGFIEVDMTFLITDGLIPPTIPAPGERGKPHWKVEFEMVMTLKGRNLKYQARYPAGEQGKVLEEDQTCVAAAFVHGTS